MKEKKAAHPAANSMSDILYVVTGFGTGYLGSMDHPKALGDLFESLIGAVYCDSGFDLVKTYPVRPLATTHSLTPHNRRTHNSHIGVQVVLRLLGGLEGVTPRTYPRHPFDIVNRVTLRAGLGHLQFCIVRCDAVPPPEGYADADAAAADARAAAAGGVASARQKHAVLTQHGVLDVRRAYRGRARVGAVWLSTVIHGGTRRGVRAACGEEVLMQMRHRKDFLRGISELEGELCVLTEAEAVARGARVAIPPDVSVSVRGDEALAEGEIRTGVWETAERAAALPGLAELQRVRDWPLDQLMDAAKERAAKARRENEERSRAAAANVDAALDV